MRFSRLEYERFGRRWIERRANKHLKCDPMQVGFPLAFHGEAGSKMLGANHILQHSIIIWPEAENDKGIREDRVPRIKGEDLQRYVWPVSLIHEPLKLFTHHQIIADPAPQD